jgi:hypothetical protein
MRLGLVFAPLLGPLACSGTGEPARSSGRASESAGPTTIVEVDAGSFHTCVRLGDGTLECWGQCHGQCGAGPSASSGRLSVGGLTSPVEIAVGNDHACARQADGDVACWGTNYNGGLGRLEPERAALPMLVPDVHEAVEIAIAGDLTCARLQGGSVMCWGAAAGDYVRTHEAATARLPRRVEGVSDARALDVTGTSACARTGDDAWQCWTWAATEAPYFRRMQPAQPAPHLRGVVQATHGTCECRLGKDGVVHCTGSGILSAQLADGSSPPVQLHECPADGLADVRTLSDPCAVMNDGTVRCWGEMFMARAGGPPINDTLREPTAIDGIGDATAIALGAKHACVLTSTGALHCWGSNSHGQIDGTPSEQGVWPPRRIDAVAGR